LKLYEEIVSFLIWYY